MTFYECPCPNCSTLDIGYCGDCTFETRYGRESIIDDDRGSVYVDGVRQWCVTHRCWVDE